MNTATPSAPAAQRTARDVLADDKYYSRLELQKLIGVAPPRDVEVKEIHHALGTGPHQQFLGSQLLAWIENNDIQYTVRNDEERIFSEDVLQPDQFYLAQSLHMWLDIPFGSLNDNTVASYPDIFTRKLGEGVHLKV